READQGAPSRGGHRAASAAVHGGAVAAPAGAGDGGRGVHPSALGGGRNRDRGGEEVLRLRRCERDSGIHRGGPRGHRSSPHRGGFRGGPAHRGSFAHRRVLTTPAGESRSRLAFRGRARKATLSGSGIRFASPTGGKAGTQALRGRRHGPVVRGAFLASSG